MNNIILIGMPGCGKSTVGVLLAKALGMDFLDTDLLIQSRENALLQNILDEKGLDAFLEAEENAILSVERESSVIATGGSAVCREPSMAHLKAQGVTVFLRLPLEELQKRLSNITTRGIAMGKGETLADVYAYRTPLYEKYADVTVDSGSMSLEETVEAVIAATAR